MVRSGRIGAPTGVKPMMGENVIPDGKVFRSISHIAA